MSTECVLALCILIALLVSAIKQMGATSERADSVFAAVVFGRENQTGGVNFNFGRTFPQPFLPLL